MDSPDTEGIVNQSFERALENNEAETDSRADQDILDSTERTPLLTSGALYTPREILNSSTTQRSFRNTNSYIARLILFQFASSRQCSCRSAAHCCPVSCSSSITAVERRRSPKFFSDNIRNLEHDDGHFYAVHGLGIATIGFYTRPWTFDWNGTRLLLHSK